MCIYIIFEYQVVGLARRIDRIDELSKRLNEFPGKLIPMRCDISKEDDILRAFKCIKEHLGPVYVLINNAGVSRPTSLIEGMTDDWRKIFDVNVLGLCICTREAVRSMRHNDVPGHIINMNSIAGNWTNQIPADPGSNVYPASKFAVSAITEVLRQELKHYGTRVKVTTISPGYVKSDSAEGYSENGTSSVPALKPEDIAEAIVYVLSTGPNVQVQELLIRPLGEPF